MSTISKSSIPQIKESLQLALRAGVLQQAQVDLALSKLERQLKGYLKRDVSIAKANLKRMLLDGLISSEQYVGGCHHLDSSITPCWACLHGVCKWNKGRV